MNYNGNVSEAKILDSDMSDLITFSVRDDAIDTNTIYIYEYDLEDTLIITRTLLNDSLIYEKYQLNGESYDLEYTVNELNKFIITYCNKENNNFATNGINNDLNSNFSKFLKFDEFYKDDISLNNNVDGNILTEIVTDVDFQNWFNSKTAQYKATNEKELRISREKACAIAGVTSFLKCTFGGGIANFICIAATGTSLVCAVATIAS